jgi:hypothetical protein
VVEEYILPIFNSNFSVILTECHNNLKKERERATERERERERGRRDREMIMKTKTEGSMWLG